MIFQLCLVDIGPDFVELLWQLRPVEPQNELFAILDLLISYICSLVSN
jgi:hypothetical protein